MKRLNINKDLFESYAKEHTLVELACEFNITKQQAKDYSHHNKIKYKLVEERHYCSNSKLYTVWKSMLSRCENPKARTSLVPCFCALYPTPFISNSLVYSLTTPLIILFINVLVKPW